MYRWLGRWALLAACCSAVDAQPLPYQFPLPSSTGLSGTFGENRTNHLHHGIDVRTFERTGLRILAAADGYVSRVRVSHSGYGKAIYITHPDGNTTAYGHCDRFYDAVEQEIHRLQRDTRQFEQEIYPAPGQFPVKRGQLIAISGNTGGSEGPHLHYEVRDKSEAILNPLSFHLSRFPDKMPPYLVRVALEPLTPTSRVQGKPDKWVLNRMPKLAGTTYTHPGTVYVEGQVGVEFGGYDRMPGSRPYLGPYGWAVYLDDSLLLDARIDRYTFDQVRQSLILLDYPYVRRTGNRLQRAYVEPGTTVDFYRTAVNQGRIELADDQPHRLRLVLCDVRGNTCTFQTTIQRGRPAPTSATKATHAPAPTAYARRGQLVLTGPATNRISIVFADSSTQELPTVVDGGSAVAALPLDPTKVPIRAEAAGWPKPLLLNYTSVITPAGGGITQAGISVSFQANSVFSTVPVALGQSASTNPLVVSDLFRIGDPTVPLFRAMSVSITPDPARTAAYPIEKIVLCEVYGNRYVRVGGESRTNSTWTGSTNSFGTYALVADMAPPTIRAINFKAGRLVAAPYLKLRLDDAISGVHPYKVEVTVDGQWMPAEYYSYQKSLFINFNPVQNAGLNGKRLRPGRHTIQVVCVDYAGNRAVQTFPFLTR